MVSKELLFILKEIESEIFLKKNVLKSDKEKVKGFSNEKWWNKG